MKAGDLFHGRYVLGRCLGTGGMGSVWEAHELPSGRKVALKVLHRHLLNDEELVTRFLQEGRAALESQFSAHVIEVLDVVNPDDRAPYLVLEYLDGENLSQILLREGPLESGRAVDLIIQTCLALAEVHSSDIIHRDIKPENIFVTHLRNGTEWVKLLDFGVAKFKRPLDESAFALTRAGCTLGTPNYMAPEQAEADSGLDHRIDIYAVGAVLYELLTGERPFEAKDPEEVMNLVSLGNPVPPTEINGEICDSLEEIVLKAMARDRKNRFDTMFDLAEALEPFTMTCVSSFPDVGPGDTVRTDPLFSSERPPDRSSSSAPTGKFLKTPPRSQRSDLPQTVIVQPKEVAVHDRPTMIKRPHVTNSGSQKEGSIPTERRRRRTRGPWWLAAFIGTAFAAFGMSTLALSLWL